MPLVFNAPSTKPNRRRLRQASTEPENRLWYFLRNRQLSGIKFRRQYAVGAYVVDFFCAQANVAIELDGDSHFSDTAQRHDQTREKYLQGSGITVIRFTNTDVMKNIEGVLEKIMAVCTSPPPSP